MYFEMIYVAFLAIIALGVIITVLVCGVDDIERRAQDRLMIDIRRREALDAQERMMQAIHADGDISVNGG